MFHLQEAFDHRLALGFAKPREGDGACLARALPQGLEDRLGSGGQIKPDRPPVGRMWALLDQAVLDDLVDQARNGDRLDLELFGQHRLGGTGKPG